MRLVAATGNKNKLREIREILTDYEIVSEADAGFSGEVEETGVTFMENALIKARAVCKACGQAALADDSGICVEALGGAPGVYSARYSVMFAPSGWESGDAGNRSFLLKNLSGEKNRKAYFCSAVAVVFPDGREVTAEGKTYGTILESERGEGGFGYDCLFYSEELKKSFGEATDEEKNGVSHRGRAMRELVKRL